MGNAVIYARYSSHNQREASIEDQIRVCSEEATRKGDTVIRTYADYAKSGTNVEGRPEFQRMIAESKRGDFEKVYVWKLDRFARNREDAIVYRGRLKLAGVRLVSATEPIAETPEGILMEAIIEAMAEWTSSNLSENIRRGLEGNALKCHHNGCQCFGYDLGSDGLYHVNEDEAEWVRLAFKMYAAGKPTTEIAKAFEPIRTRFGNPWTKNTIADLLRNEKYAGVYKFGTHRVEDGVEPIVSKELFSMVNAHLGKPKHDHYEYPLSGVLFDAEGRRFVGSYGTGKSGKKYYYYRVQETGESYRREVLDEAVNRAVSQFLASDESLRDAIADAVVQVQGEALSDDIKLAESLRARLEETDRKIANLYDLVAMRGASKALADKIDALEEEREAISLEVLEAERMAPRLDRDMVLAFLNAIVGEEAPPVVVRAFVSRVVVDGDYLTVTFTFKKANPAPGEGDGCSTRVPLVELSHPRPNILSVSVYPWGFAFKVRWR